MTLTTELHYASGKLSVKALTPGIHAISLEQTLLLKWDRLDGCEEDICTMTLNAYIACLLEGTKLINDCCMVRVLKLEQALILSE